MGGLVICRQAPPTAQGHVFLTLEDETGMANVVCAPRSTRARPLVRTHPLLLARGRVQREQGVVNLLATAFTPLDAGALGPAVRSHDFR